MSGNNSGTLHTCDSEANQYYLNVTSGSLTVSTSSTGATSWTKATNQLYTSSGTRYYIYCDSGIWGVSSSTSITKYRMVSSNANSKCIINSGTTGLTASTSTADSTYIWEYSGSGTRQVYTYINGTKYYLYTTTNRNPTVGLQTGEFSWTYSSNKLY
jgi:hypothetical protein